MTLSATKLLQPSRQAYNYKNTKATSTKTCGCTLFKTEESLQQRSTLPVYSKKPNLRNALKGCPLDNFSCEKQVIVLHSQNNYSLPLSNLLSICTSGSKPVCYARPASEVENKKTANQINETKCRNCDTTSCPGYGSPYAREQHTYTRQVGTCSSLATHWGDAPSQRSSWCPVVIWSLLGSSSPDARQAPRHQTAGWRWKTLCLPSRAWLCASCTWVPCHPHTAMGMSLSRGGGLTDLYVGS